MIQKLKAAGQPTSTIEEVTGVSERSIRRIAKEAPITDLENATAQPNKGSGRPSGVAQYVN